MLGCHEETATHLSVRRQLQLEYTEGLHQSRRLGLIASILASREHSKLFVEPGFGLVKLGKLGEALLLR